MSCLIIGTVPSYIHASAWLTLCSLRKDPTVQRKNPRHSGRLSPPPQPAAQPPSPDANHAGPSVSCQCGVPEPVHPTTWAAASIFPPELTELVTGMTKAVNGRAEGGPTMQERHEALQMAQRIFNMEGLPSETKDKAQRVIMALATTLDDTFSN